MRYPLRPSRSEKLRVGRPDCRGEVAKMLEEDLKR